MKGSVVHTDPAAIRTCSQTDKNHSHPDECSEPLCSFKENCRGTKAPHRARTSTKIQENSTKMRGGFTAVPGYSRKIDEGE